MRHHTKLSFRSDEGQSIVEFAIVLPVLVLLIFGITQFGLAFRNYISITDAARVGARAAAVKRTSSPCAAASTAIQSTVSAGQWSQDLEPHHMRRRPECRRPGLDLDPVPVFDRPPRRQRLGQPHRQREGADGMRARSARLGRDESGQVFVFVACSSSSRWSAWPRSSSTSARGSTPRRKLQTRPTPLRSPARSISRRQQSTA